MPKKKILRRLNKSIINPWFEDYFEVYNFLLKKGVDPVIADKAFDLHAKSVAQLYEKHKLIDKEKINKLYFELDYSYQKIKRRIESLDDIFDTLDQEMKKLV